MNRVRLSQREPPLRRCQPLRLLRFLQRNRGVHRRHLCLVVLHSHTPRHDSHPLTLARGMVVVVDLSRGCYGHVV